MHDQLRNSELARRRAVEDAAIAGQTIQGRRRDPGATWFIVDNVYPSAWLWPDYEYRVKPEHAVRMHEYENGCAFTPHLENQHGAIRTTEFVEVTPEVRAALTAAGIETEAK